MTHIKKDYIQSILLQCSNRPLYQSEIDIWLKKFDISASNTIHIEMPESSSSIGIDQIHELKRTLAVGFSNDTNRGAIIHNIEHATIPAQNALLKTIEEPPERTLIIITTASPGRVLPTIRSRCSIITVAKDTNNQESSSTALTNSQSDRMLKAEELSKDKDTALEWLDTMERQYHQELVTHPTDNTRSNIEKIFRARTLVSSSNVNRRLLLENLLLEL